MSPNDNISRIIEKRRIKNKENFQELKSLTKPLHRLGKWQ